MTSKATQSHRKWRNSIVCHFLLVAYSNNVSLLHRSSDIITFRIHDCLVTLRSPSVSLQQLVSVTRRPASADRTARQPVSRTQASDAMTPRLPRYEAKCMQRRCFQCRSVPLRSDIKGTEQPPANILIPLERQSSALQPCR